MLNFIFVNFNFKKLCFIFYFFSMVAFFVCLFVVLFCVVFVCYCFCFFVGLRLGL